MQAGQRPELFERDFVIECGLNAQGAHQDVREHGAVSHGLNCISVGRERAAQVCRLLDFAEQQKLKIMRMDPNDPTRTAEIQKMRAAAYQSDSYFGSRIQANEGFGWSNEGYDFGGTMTSNLESLKGRLDQANAALLQQHAYLLQDPTKIQPQTQPLNNMSGVPPQPAPSGTTMTPARTPLNNAQVSRAMIPRNLSKR